jgi:hypothetical protein
MECPIQCTIRRIAAACAVPTCTLCLAMKDGSSAAPAITSSALRGPPCMDRAREISKMRVWTALPAWLRQGASPARGRDDGAGAAKDKLACAMGSVSVSVSDDARGSVPLRLQLPSRHIPLLASATASAPARPPRLSCHVVARPVRRSAARYKHGGLAQGKL